MGPSVDAIEDALPLHVPSLLGRVGRARRVGGASEVNDDRPTLIDRLRLAVEIASASRTLREAFEFWRDRWRPAGQAAHEPRIIECGKYADVREMARRQKEY